MPAESAVTSLILYSAVGNKTNTHIRPNSKIHYCIHLSSCNRWK